MLITNTDMQVIYFSASELRIAIDKLVIEMIQWVCKCLIHHQSYLYEGVHKYYQDVWAAVQLSVIKVRIQNDAQTLNDFMY